MSQIGNARLHIEEREHWNEYLRVYEEAFNHISTDTAPWYIIPDNYRSCLHNNHRLDYPVKAQIPTFKNIRQLIKTRSMNWQKRKPY